MLGRADATEGGLLAMQREATRLLLDAYDASRDDNGGGGGGGGGGASPRFAQPAAASIGSSSNLTSLRAESSTPLNQSSSA
eukprot:1088942-Prymnesium_polylepis.1